MLNTLHPMYIWWGRDGACLYNDAYRLSIGPERHPCSLGQPVREVWAEIWPIIGPQIEQVMAGGPATWHENQLVPITRSGRREDVYWTYSFGPIGDPAASNGIGGVLVVCTETTASVMAKRDLAAQADRQQRLFQRAPGFMAMLDGPHHAIVSVNAALMRLVGDRTVLGRTVAEALPDAVAQGCLDLLDTVFRTGETFSAAGAKYAVKANPGGPVHDRYLDFVFQPVTDADECVTGIFVEGHDVTDRTVAEAALRQSEMRLRELNASLERRVTERTAELQVIETRFHNMFETSFQLQGLLALDGTLLDTNLTSLAVIENVFADVAGKLFWETPWFTATPGMPERVRANVAAAARGETVRQEVSVRVPAGLRTFDFSIRAMRDPDGTIIAIVPEAVDITDRRVAEESLRQARKLEAMGQLTGGVAHDFNNLLTPIMGSFDMLIRAGVGNERQRRLIDGGMKSAERAKTLIHRLLAFARRQPLQIQTVDLSRLVPGMAELLASTLGPHIKVAVELAADLPPAKADPNQLEMAILNLSVNARDAMPRGGNLAIAATPEAVGPGHRSQLPTGRYVCLSVADNGIGMNRTTARRAIEPFFSTKGVGQGTGLGLSMAHGLVAQLGGALIVVSKLGVGTKIELWLPVADTTVAAVLKSPEIATLGRAMGSVLLVDDEDLVRVSTSEMLGELGFNVTEAESAEDALRIMDNGAAIDMVITDHLMPGMTGVDLAYTLRVRYPGVPVLVISGFAEMEGIAHDLHRLMKPFRQAELSAMIADMRKVERDNTEHSGS